MPGRFCCIRSSRGATCAERPGSLLLHSQQRRPGFCQNSCQAARQTESRPCRAALFYEKKQPESESIFWFLCIYSAAFLEYALYKFYIGQSLDPQAGILAAGRAKPEAQPDRRISIFCGRNQNTKLPEQHILSQTEDINIWMHILSSCCCQE